MAHRKVDYRLTPANVACRMKDSEMNRHIKAWLRVNVAITVKRRSN